MQIVTAIYEHGVLRPLQPLNLNESERVQIQIGPVLEPQAAPTQDRATRAALLAFAGCIHSSDAQSADNDRIDSDLATEYASQNGSVDAP